MPTGSDPSAHTMRVRVVAANAPAASGKKRRRERVIGLLTCGRYSSRGPASEPRGPSMRIGDAGKNESLLRISERCAASNDFYQLRAAFGKEIPPRVNHRPHEALPGFLHHKVIALPFRDDAHGGG